MDFIKFKCSKLEKEQIKKIVDRMCGYDSSINSLHAEMDLTACHLNGCALDLPRLLKAPKAVLGHDFYGIRKYLDRSTGKLTGNFDPRCSLPEQAEEAA